MSNQNQKVEESSIDTPAQDHRAGISGNGFTVDAVIIERPVKLKQVVNYGRDGADCWWPKQVAISAQQAKAITVHIWKLAVGR
ncbi:hypothetical protein [Paracandidimonas lactea]|uniref:hypothetical protein n=1 Tax=Paracandidimonas lactea TaxID=2895524 RepID=UPI001F228D1F|nr:hypothetical protein [Paracandidimonas lactea]